MANPIAVRLTDDLEVAFRARAEAEGLSSSELLRAIVAQYVYNEQPSTDAGYHVGRALAYQTAIALVKETMEQSFPPTFEQAQQLVVQGRVVRR